MARIYQGGQAEKRYKGNARDASFKPNQVTNKNKAIKQEGDAAIRDLQTQDRERRRNEEMSRVSRRAQDQADQSDLRISQQQVTDQLRLQQQVDKNILDVTQTKDKAFLSSQQLIDRNDLSFKFSTKKNSQAFSQKLEQDTLRLKDLDEKTNLGIESRALAANSALESQALQASQSIDNSNRAITHSIIQGLVDFGVAGLKQYSDNKVQQQKEADLEVPYDFLFSDKGSPQNNGAVIKENSDILASEVAFEQGVKQVAPGAPMQQQDIRSSYTDVSFGRNIQQRDINNAAVSFPGELYRALEDPNTKVLVNGEMMPFSQVPAGYQSEAINQIARQLTTEMGITKKGNAHAMIMSYGRSVKAAIASELGVRRPFAQAKEKNVKYDMARQNAASQVANSQYQTAWDTLKSNYISSGKSGSKGDVEINDDIVNELLAVTPPDKVGKLRDVSFQKSGQQGRTRLGDQPKYEKLIKAAERGERTARYNDMAMTSKENKMIVEKIEGEMARELIYNKDESPEVIRNRYIARLEQNGSDEALIARAAIIKAGVSIDPEIERQIREGFRNGNPWSKDEINEAAINGQISMAFRNEAETLGETADVAQKALDTAGIDTEAIAKKLVKSVMVRKSAGNLKGAELDMQAEMPTQRYAKRMEQELLNFAKNRNGRPPTTAEMYQEAKRLEEQFLKEMQGSDGGTTLGGDFTYSPTSNSFSYEGSYYGRGVAARNASTGEAMDDFSLKTMSEIDSSGSFADSKDLYLTQENFLEDVKALDDSGGKTFSSRTMDLAAKFNISPLTFLKNQASALGYGNLGFNSYTQAVDNYQPDNMYEGKKLFQSFGFPDEGASYLAGSVMTESSWIANRINKGDASDGTDSKGLGQWNMGRIKAIEGFMGGTPIEKASSGQQVEAMIKEMKQSYKSSYRTLMTPGLPAARYEEAIKDYWNYGDVGQRNQYAQQLISSGGQYISPGQGVRSFTGALTYQDNKQSYRDVADSMQAAGFQVREQSDFGSVGQHASNSYHKYDEAFDVTHQTGDYATSIAKTQQLKEVIRSLNLFKEVIGPGDGDPKHEVHLHLGGLLRPMTSQDLAMINSVN